MLGLFFFMKEEILTMIKPGIKGKCLTCKYFMCESGTAWCHGNMMREIYTTHITDEERLSINSQEAKKSLRAKKKDETMKKLLTKVNPSWCIFRKM